MYTNPSGQAKEGFSGVWGRVSGGASHFKKLTLVVSVPLSREHGVSGGFNLPEFQVVEGDSLRVSPIGSASQPSSMVPVTKEQVRFYGSNLPKRDDRISQKGVSPSLPKKGDADAGSRHSGARDLKIDNVTDVATVNAVSNVVDGDTVSVLESLLLERLYVVFGMKSKLGLPMIPLDGIDRSSSVRAFTVAYAITLKRESNDRPPLPPLTGSGELKSDPIVVRPVTPVVVVSIVRTPGVFVSGDYMLPSCG